MELEQVLLGMRGKLSKKEVNEAGSLGFDLVNGRRRSADGGMVIFVAFWNPQGIRLLMDIKDVLAEEAEKRDAHARRRNVWEGALTDQE